MPSTHVTDRAIERFCGRQLPAAELVVFADHVAACADCRRRLQAAGDMDAAEVALARELDDVVDHIPEAEVQAYVDRSVDRGRRLEIERHLASCASCASEVRDLQTFAADHRRSLWPIYAGLAAAAGIILAVAASSLVWRPDSEPPRVVLTDQGGSIQLSTGGVLSGVEGLSPAHQEIVRQSLVSGRLPLPATLAELTGVRGTLLGESGAAALRLLAPLGTVVLTDRPTLKWTAISESTTYTVTWQDRTSGEMSSSPPLHATEWTPGSPLIRGRTYAWQVAGLTGREEIVAPRPPAPPAMFAVLDAATASSLERLPSSRLARGILYAQTGALDDAEREIAAVSARNPGSPVVDAFLKELRSARRER